MTSGAGLPNFFVIGAAKTGTTSLHHYLGQHPQIFTSPVKEPRFFAFEGQPLDFSGPDDRRYRGGITTTLESYLELFAGVDGERAVGESSVMYLELPRVAAAIQQRIPEARLVAVLRDPVERAYSSYLFNRRDGFEPLGSFEEALRAEPERMAAGWYHGWAYGGRGFYHRHLVPYYERFGAAQIRVFLYEDFLQDPRGMLAEIFRFLEVDDGFEPDLGVWHNRSGQPRSDRIQRMLTTSNRLKEAAKRVVPERWGHRVIDRLQRPNLRRPPVRPETRAALVEGYREDIERLQGLIGRDLSPWLRSD